MSSIIRGLAVYVILLIIFRISGRRTLSNMTSFDLVLLLIVSEAIQQALIDDDNSAINGLLIVMTLVITDIGFALLKRRSARIQKLVDGVPTIVVDNGRPLQERMRCARIDENDVLSAARELQGLATMSQIQYAVLEANGKITIIPKPGALSMNTSAETASR
jgi:uncharacterized membrane protein YcaP (DUF421 family)